MHVRLDAGDHRPQVRGRPSLPLVPASVGQGAGAHARAPPRAGRRGALLDEIAADIANGADCSSVGYLDFEAYAPGELYRRNLATKGLRASVPALVTRRVAFGVDDAPAGLDWYPPEHDPGSAPFRWSGPNPNPRYLIPARVAGRFALRIRILAFAEPHLASSLTLDVDGREAPFAFETAADGTTVLAIAPLDGPADDGIVVGFHLPRCGRLWSDPRHKRAGLALADIEVVPLDPPPLTTRTE
jgi:hypothetical protein